MLLKKKTAVITGCNRGIGKKILEVFSENGATVFACVRKNDDKFKKFTNDLKKKNNTNIIPVELDLNSDESVEKSAQIILNSTQTIDILVNNAGIIQNSLFQMTTIDSLKKIFQINYFSLTRFTQYILKSIIKNKGGSIVYIASTSAQDNTIGRNAYSSTKAAIISQAHTLSREVGRFNIRVNSVSPGLTETEMMKKNTPEKTLNDVLANLSLKRIAAPEEIAKVVLFLSSVLSCYVTGQYIRVDGGM